MRYLLLVLTLLCAPVAASSQAQEPVTVSSWYGDLTVTGDSVRYTTPAGSGAISRDLVAALVRPDMIAEGQTLPDRSDPWVVGTVESQLVFARSENGPLPAFPPLRVMPDSLDFFLAQIEAALAAERARADSAEAALVVLQGQQEQLVAAAVEAERAAVYARLRAWLETLVNPQ